jgi:hypothetical protein
VTHLRNHLLARISRRVAPLALGSVLLLGCSRGTQLTIVNQSNETLQNVVVSGSGFSEAVGSIRPHEDLRLFVYPRGESSLHVRFNARGGTMSFGPEGYFEGTGGYVVTITVAPSLDVSVRSELTKY